MKVLVCLAAVCLIVWCAADIAIKLEQGKRLAGIEKALYGGDGYRGYR